MAVVITTSFAFHFQHLTALTYSAPTSWMDTHLPHSQIISRTTFRLSRRSDDLGMNSNMPTADELMTQKAEAYNALSSFHETSSLQTKSDQVRSLLRGLDTMGIDGITNEEVKAEYWECAQGAITYLVPIDPAAGIKVGCISKPYRSSVKIDMGELSINRKSTQQKKGLRLVESFQFLDSIIKQQQSSSLTLPFVRSIQLGANVDVDSVDGSYSLDSTISASTPPSADDEDDTPLPLLPPSLLNGVDPSAIQYIVEHTLAVSDTQRCRCFFLFGSIDDSRNESNDDKPTMNDDDFAILAARTAAENDKRKRDTEKDQSTNNDRSYVLIGLILAEETKVMPTPKTATIRKSLLKSEKGSEEVSTPLDFLEIKGQNDKEEDRMDRLMKSIENHNKKVMEEQGDVGTSDHTALEMQLYNIGMFGLTSGVWLGDAFIREGIVPSKLKQGYAKGFGDKLDSKSNDDGDEADRFATWLLGVQKCSMQFNWDYSQSIAQIYNWGKCMGTATSLSSMVNVKSEGLLVMNEARRMKKREEQRVVFDYEGGSYVAGLIGSSYFRVPRYMYFSQQSLNIRREPYLTEYMVFLRPTSDESSKPSATSELGSIDADVETLPEHFCSRTSRLYDAKDGTLMQGSTAFFALQQPTTDTEY